MKKYNPYEENGFSSRQEYLESLADEHGVPLDVVLTVADLYGPSEDFDGLINALEDYAMGQNYDDIF